MTHRAESIMQAVVAKVTGLSTTGSNVTRGRVHAADTLPALSVYQGDDRVVSEYSHALYDCELTVFIEALAKTSSAQIETALNQIREEITIALQTDYTQGLGYVLNTAEGDSAAPELSGEGEEPSGMLRMEWRILYRRSRTNPGA